MEESPNSKHKNQVRFGNFLPFGGFLLAAAGICHFVDGNMRDVIVGVGLLWAGVALLITYHLRH